MDVAVFESLDIGDIVMFTGTTDVFAPKLKEIPEGTLMQVGHKSRPDGFVNCSYLKDGRTALSHQYFKHDELQLIEKKEI